MCIVLWGSREECLSLHLPDAFSIKAILYILTFAVFFNLELKTSVHQTLGSISL